MPRTLRCAARIAIIPVPLEFGALAIEDERRRTPVVRAVPGGLAALPGRLLGPESLEAGAAVAGILRHHALDPAGVGTIARCTRVPTGHAVTGPLGDRQSAKTRVVHAPGHVGVAIALPGLVG